MPIAIVGGGMILVLFAFIPLVVVLVRGLEPFSAFNIVWLLFPAFSLLFSGLDWLGGRRRRATVDALVAGGVSWVWFFLTTPDVVQGYGIELGMWPFLLSGTTLFFTLVGFVLLIWTLSPTAQDARDRGKASSPGLRLFYILVLVASLAAMILVWGLEIFFKLLA